MRLKSIVVAMFSPVAVLAAGFHGVHTSNGADVWAVGNTGSVFWSTNGGTSWSSMTLGNLTLRSVVVSGSIVRIVGDQGTCFVSTDGGNIWDDVSLGTTNTLRAMVFTDANNGFIVGDNGTLLKTTDGGQTWEPRASSTSGNLHAVAFSNSNTGYAVGTAGTLVKTTDTGTSWSPLTVGFTGSSEVFTSVAACDSVVYVTGTNGTCMKSIDGGETWTSLKFKTDVRSDVHDVFAHDASRVVFTGGGGFIRITGNAGASFEWGQHQMHAPLSDIFFLNSQNGWACSPNNNAILRTNDGGNTWSLPQGTTVTYLWSQKLNLGGSTVRGNAFSINPFNKNMVYCALGNRVYASYDRGDNWIQIANMPSPGSKVNSFYVSPKDSNTWVAAYGSPDRIVRTTNRGMNWTDVISRQFTEYGMPLEMDGSHPDTLLFGPEDGHLYRSTDFGSSWDTLSFPDFRSPCDLVVVREFPNVLWCGDGITGSGNGEMFRSTDGGLNWTLMFTTTGSEIPTVANGDQDPAIGYATAWGSGGVRSTKNFGEEWNSIATTGSTWGVDIAKDDPNVVLYGVYGGATSYLSTNGGNSFSTSSLNGSNYALFCYDRSTFLAQQSGGLWKYNITYTVPTNVASVSLLTPDGGESWQFGSTHDITWAAAGVGSIKIEYKTGPSSPWQTITENTPAVSGSYAWDVPNAPSNQVRVRISNVFGGNPVDSSNAFFAITTAAISATPASLTFQETGVGTSSTDTVMIYNAGTGTLVVTSITSATSAFGVSRGSFSIPAGMSDTITVIFSPDQVQAYDDTLTVASNATGNLQIPVTGNGSPASSAGEDIVPTVYALWQNYPNPFNPSTRMSYDIPKSGLVTLSVYNILGQQVATLVNQVQDAGRYSVEFGGRGEIQLPTGMYIYKLQSGDFTAVRKMLLVK